MNRELPLLITFREADNDPHGAQITDVGFLGKAPGRYGRRLIKAPDQVDILDKTQFLNLSGIIISIGDELQYVALPTVTYTKRIVTSKKQSPIPQHLPPP